MFTIFAREQQSALTPRSLCESSDKQTKNDEIEYEVHGKIPANTG